VVVYHCVDTHNHRQLNCPSYTGYRSLLRSGHTKKQERVSQFSLHHGCEQSWLTFRP